MTPCEKLVALRDALRAPMPEGFVWDYERDGAPGSACGCAIRLASVNGLLRDRSWNTFDFAASWAKEFGISPQDAERIFIDAEVEVGKTWAGEVTPADVATVIDRVLAEGV